MLPRLVAAVLLVTGAISCGPGDASSRGGAPSVVTGVVVEVESPTLNQVESFTVKDGERRYKILVDGGTAFSFTPSHLNQHRATAEPVRVDVASRDGALYAVAVDDA